MHSRSSPPQMVLLLVPVIGMLARPVSSRVMSLFVESTALLSRRGQPSALSVLVLGLANPVQLRVIPNAFVEWVYQDHFEPFAGSVLGDPVTIENAHIWQHFAHSLFRHRLQTDTVFQRVNSVIGWFSPNHSLSGRPAHIWQHFA